MTAIVTVKKPVRRSPNHIDLIVVLDNGRELPFTASPDDPEEHGRTLYENAVRGDYGPVA